SVRDCPMLFGKCVKKCLTFFHVAPPWWLSALGSWCVRLCGKIDPVQRLLDGVLNDGRYSGRPFLIVSIRTAFGHIGDLCQFKLDRVYAPCRLAILPRDVAAFEAAVGHRAVAAFVVDGGGQRFGEAGRGALAIGGPEIEFGQRAFEQADRKSTRLNSSHVKT